MTAGSPTPNRDAAAEPSSTRLTACVTAAWVFWGGFAGTAAWLQGVFADAPIIAGIVAAFALLGAGVSLLRAFLPVRDRTVAGLAAGAAVGGIVGLTAGGVFGVGSVFGPAAGLPLFAALGLLCGLACGAGFTLTGLMVANLGLAKTAQLIAEDAARQSGSLT